MTNQPANQPADQIYKSVKSKDAGMGIVWLNASAANNTYALAVRKADADSNGKVGAVGFCYGGGVCNAMSVRLPDLAASVPFYGRQAKAADVPRIKSPLLLHYAGLDKRINQGWPDYEAALKANGKDFAVHFYPNTNHGFHNDTTPRYDMAAAELAWSRTVDFFNAHLS